MIAHDRLLAMVAALGLGENHGLLVPEPMHQVAWSKLLCGVAAQRIEPSLVAAIEAGNLPATGAQRAQAVALQRKAIISVLRLEQSLLQATGELEARGIDVRVLKGPALARTLYADPLLRSYCDVDILVRPAAFDVAIATITSMGGQRRYQQPRLGFDRHFTKAASFTMPDGAPIDVHRSLVVGPFGHTIVLEDLFEQPVPIEIAGRNLWTLPPEVGCVHVCLHAALGDWPMRLVPLRDVAEFTRAPHLDLGAVVEVTRRWRVAAPVTSAVRAAGQILGSDASLADAVEPWAGWTQRRALALYQRPDRDYRTLAVASVPFVPTIRAKARYISQLAFPDRTFVASRGGYTARPRAIARALRAAFGRDPSSTHRQRAGAMGLGRDATESRVRR